MCVRLTGSRGTKEYDSCGCLLWQRRPLQKLRWNEGNFTEENDLLLILSFSFFGLVRAI